ncbi:unnamed protein product [Polarella glacialis]|uniref:Uncharacterized protein n=1 Tax=Polarella glacialis TaxID=89957 RepID=A0A813GN57_POLGL|nr:unnamed protein product [Polarella glacialis]
MPSTYKASTYAASALWRSDTKIKYGPNPKGGKSYIRYAAYEKSATIEKSLENGSKPEDLLFDYEKGHLQIIGPLRAAPLDPFKMKPQDFENLTKADEILIRYGCRHDPKRKAGSEERIKDITKTLKEVGRQSAQLKKLRIANHLGMDSTQELEGRLDGVAYIQRLAADQAAKEVLATVAKANRKISEHEVVMVLDQWGFAMNPNRINVMREGVEWVHSDTLGAIARRDGLILPTPPTTKYPNFMKVLTKYLSDHMPEEYKTRFGYTSINVNKDYAGARHRDQGNRGPSFLKAFGDFKGGELQYLPGDDRSRKLEELSPCEALTFDAKNGFILFDGNRAHEVQDFKGHRYSLVYFTCNRSDQMPAENQKALNQLGIKYPTADGIEKLKATLDTPVQCSIAPAEKGRSAAAKLAARGKAKVGSTTLPGYGYWPLTKDQQKLEETAKKVWKDRPTQAPKLLELFNKRKREDWSVNQAIPLGPEVKSSLKPLILKGYTNIVDAVDALTKTPELVPKSVLKAGYGIAYTNRTKFYYIVYHADYKEAAMKVAGVGPLVVITEVKSKALKRVAAARKIRLSSGSV